LKTLYHYNPVLSIGIWKKVREKWKISRAAAFGCAAQGEIVWVDFTHLHSVFADTGKNN
jgi:hypothetical protein